MKALSDSFSPPDSGCKFICLFYQQHSVTAKEQSRILSDAFSDTVLGAVATVVSGEQTDSALTSVQQVRVRAHQALLLHVIWGQVLHTLCLSFSSVNKLISVSI